MLLDRELLRDRHGAIVFSGCLLISFTSSARPADCVEHKRPVAGRRDGVGPPMAISPTVSIVRMRPCPVRSKGPKKPMSSAHQDKPFENCDRNHNEMQAALWF